MSSKNLVAEKRKCNEVGALRSEGVNNGANKSRNIRVGAQNTIILSLERKRVGVQEGA